MNGSKPCGPSGGFQAPSPKRRRPRIRASYFPSRRPSPAGEGETFAHALVIRPSLVVVCLRNERQRSGDCNRNVRIFPRRASALPLLGERVGVRGNEANSNRQAHNDSRNCQTPRVLRSGSGAFQLDHELLSASNAFVSARRPTGGLLRLRENRGVNIFYLPES